MVCLNHTYKAKREIEMYKDIVIKQRVWMPGDEIDAWDVLDVGEPIEYESTIVDFNGRIPIENGVIVGEWMTNGIQLIKSEYGELLSRGKGRIETITIDQINRFLDQIKSTPGNIVPIGIYDHYRFTAIQLSDGTNIATIDLKHFQYIYDGDFCYELLCDLQPGLVLKRGGLVCGAVMGMNTTGTEPIWQRPYSLVDVEALSPIQGDPALP